MRALEKMLTLAEQLHVLNFPRPTWSVRVWLVILPLHVLQSDRSGYSPQSPGLWLLIFQFGMPARWVSEQVSFHGHSKQAGHVMSVGGLVRWDILVLKEKV